jgi:hypothetical protein
VDLNNLIKDLNQHKANLVKKEEDKGKWKFIGTVPKVEYITDSYFPSTFKLAYQQFWLTKIEYTDEVIAHYESGYEIKLVINKSDFEILLNMEVLIHHWFPQLTFIQIKEFK